MYFVLIGAILLLLVLIFLAQPKFGKIPRAERLSIITTSENYRDKKFQNLNFTPDLSEGVSYTKVLREFIFNRSKRLEPKEILPFVKTDLKEINPNASFVVWFGHSSYLLLVDGKRILVDPVFSGNASPVSFTTKSFKGTNTYGVEDMPDIDLLIITHDHWDHLDYETVSLLKPKVQQVVTGLGTAQHLELWGFDKGKIHEVDWNDSLDLEDGWTIHATPARHFSGRGLKRNKSLWMSFVLQTPTLKLYIGGDSGYDTHFKTIGEKHGPFDIAFLECGQYHANWKYIHMMPEEVIQAALDLKATCTMPVHWAKFALAQHDWDEPILRITAEAKRKNYSLVHPRIGETVDLTNPTYKYTEWWTTVN